MYVKITDKGECFSTTTENVNGVYANRTEWAKHNFYPKNGMVGEVVKRTPQAYVVKIKDGIYVPMTRRGIEEITYEEYKAGQVNNVCTGMDEKQKQINDDYDEFIRKHDTIGDMRSSFKKDIIQNMKMLTCDFERRIFILDLEESAVMYAIDMCLEYRNKSGMEMSSATIKRITGQVCDVFMELFKEFRQSNKNICEERVINIMANPEIARAMVDIYYQRVINRYNLH